MRTNHLIFSIITFVVLNFATGCGEEGIELQGTQEVFFEVIYSNNAWGEQFKGFIIDKEGRIRTYDKPATWNQADGKAGLTAEQLQRNLENTAISSVKIAVEDFKSFSSKVNAISDSAFSKPVSGGADRGITSFYAYHYDAGKQVYRPVLLNQTGDLEMYNKDQEAIEVSAWLTGILDEVY